MAAKRTRMSASERREQLIAVARGLFAERGFDATSVEEVAARAQVSKPVVYEHFGGKEGLYAVVVDREMETLLEMVTSSLSKNRSLYRIQQVALALLTYMEERTDGFRILVRGDSTASTDETATYSSLLNDAISQVEHILAGDFERRGFDPALAPLYAQALVGMVSLTGQWWLAHPTMQKDEVAAHLVNLAWNGLTALDPARSAVLAAESTLGWLCAAATVRCVRSDGRPVTVALGLGAVVQRRLPRILQLLVHDPLVVRDGVAATCVSVVHGVRVRVECAGNRCCSPFHAFHVVGRELHLGTDRVGGLTGFGDTLGCRSAVHRVLHLFITAFCVVAAVALMLLSSRRVGLLVVVCSAGATGEHERHSERSRCQSCSQSPLHVISFHQYAYPIPLGGTSQDLCVVSVWINRKPLLRGSARVGWAMRR